MPTVFDVANFFITATKRERENGLSDDLITHLKLQKLVYYAQGFSLAMNNEPLFDAPIEAWEHGPVCPILYQKYKSYVNQPIDSDITYQDAIRPFVDKQLDVLRFVYKYFGFLSASMLRKLSHQDAAWIKARANGGIDLTLDDMKESCTIRLLAHVEDDEYYDEEEEQFY